MDLHCLKLFHIAATERNMTEAANKLYLTQPALSMQLKKFEQQLGIRLFDKVGNRNVLNDNGRLLYNYSQQVFSIIDEAKIALMENKDLITGNLVIGGSNTAGTYILPKMIGIFKKLYPKVKVNLHVADTSEITKLVMENKLDFAINGGYITYNNNIYCEKLMEDRMIFAVAPHSVLARKRVIVPEDLQGISFVGHERQSQLYLFIEKIIEEYKLPTEITMTFNNIDAIKQAVEADLGVSIIPYSAVRNELNTGLIEEISLQNQSWYYPLSLIYNKGRHLSPASLKMIDIVKKHMPEFIKEIQYVSGPFE